MHSMLGLVLLLAVVGSKAAGGGLDSLERRYQITMPSSVDLRGIRDRYGLAIDRVSGKTATVYASEQLAQELAAAGFGPRLVKDDFWRQDAEPEGQAQWPARTSVYPSYAEICSVMTDLAARYPMVLSVETLGYSVQGRTILASAPASLCRVTDRTCPSPHSAEMRKPPFARRFSKRA
ncbi:MAG: hypothetical protein ABIK62_04595, partial [candidate division WOR-3 bacterium]